MTELRGQEFWDSIAQEFSVDRTLGRKYILDPALFNVIGDIVGQRVLDVACGSGNITIPMAQSGASCMGVDYAPKPIEFAKTKAEELGLKIDFRVLNAKDVANLRRRFDLATVALLFPHLPSFEDAQQVMEALARVIPVGGRLVVGEPHPAFDFYMRNRLISGNFDYFNSGLPYDFTMNIGDDSFNSEAYHWTLENYSNLFKEACFAISRIVEPQPLPESQLVSDSWFKDKFKFPSYIIFDCIKTG